VVCPTTRGQWGRSINVILNLFQDLGSNEIPKQVRNDREEIMKLISEILYAALTILILVLLPFIVFTLVTSKTDRLGGIQSFVVLSGSMEPSIPAGSIIYAKDAKEFHIGDVISFKKGSDIVTHRIVHGEKTDNKFSYYTKGDANNNIDSEVVAQKDVLGKSIFFVPFVGKFVLFLKSFPGYALFIIFPTVFFIVFEANNIRKEITRHAEKRAIQKLQAA